MMKVTVLYGIPASTEQFEAHYHGTHLPIAATVKGVARLELTKFLPGPDGAKPAYHRMAEIYFESAAQMQQSLQSPEGMATVADIPKFATGGATMLVGTVEG